MSFLEYIILFGVGYYVYRKFLSSDAAAKWDSEDLEDDDLDIF